MPIPKVVARFNRHVTNPLARLIAGRLPPFAVVLHRGRVSGREYRTPVWAFSAPSGYVIALTYGADSEWTRNVLAAGHCVLRRRGRLVPVTDPRVIRGREGRGLMPIVLRPAMRLLNVTEFLHMTSVPPKVASP